MPRRRRNDNLRIYAGLTIACAVIAMIAHYLFEAPARVREYAEAELETAVRSAVRQEVRSAAESQTP